MHMKGGMNFEWVDSINDANWTGFVYLIVRQTAW